jgi:hypothetical protein
VTAPAGSDRDQRALDAATVAALDQGVTLPPGALSLACSHSCCPGTGTLHVALTVKATLPGLAAVGRAGGTVPVTGRHDEVVDRFAAPVAGC